MSEITKKAILQALVDGVLTELSPKTGGDSVWLDESTTVSAKIAEMVAALNGKVTSQQLTQALADYVQKEAGKGLSAQDFTAAFKSKLEGIAAGAQVNVLEGIQVNGGDVTLTGKKANIAVPTKVSDLENDRKYQTEEQVNAKISSVYKPGGSLAFADLPELAEENLGMVYNVTDAFVTTADFVEGAGVRHPKGSNVVIVSVNGGYKYDALAGFVDLTPYAKTEDMTAALGSKVDKETGRRLMTDAEGSKLAGVEAGAQVNTIEAVKVNGDAQSVGADKSVDITVPTGALADKDQVSEEDLTNELKEKVNAAAEGNHSHLNKDVLDGITSALVTGWNGKSRVLVAAVRPGDLAAGDLWIQVVD